MKATLIVVRSTRAEKLKEQYEALGMTFDYHQHGKGPFHYSAEMGGLVFEIYPTDHPENVDKGTRLGFKIDDYEQRTDLISKKWDTVSPIKETEWGKMMILKDLDGRKVELTV